MLSVLLDGHVLTYGQSHFRFVKTLRVVVYFKVNQSLGYKDCYWMLPEEH